MQKNMDVMVFTNEAINANIRSVEIDGDPWFVAKDICECLGTKTKHIRSIIPEKYITPLPPNVDAIDLGSNGGSEEGDNVEDRSNGGRVPLLVSEAGLYLLVFKSRKPEAMAFTEWVAGEVLPSIRRTGEYKLRKHFERQIDAAWDRTSEAWKEVRKVKNEYYKYQFTYPGKYYTLWDTPYNTGDKEDCIKEMNELSLKRGYGIMVTKDRQYAWHRDIWKEHEEQHYITVK